MTTEEIKTIKKRINAELENFHGLHCCYVNAAGEKEAEMYLPVYDMTVEEKEMYAGVLKKILSGKKEKTLFDILIPTSVLDESEAGKLLTDLERTECTYTDDDSLRERLFEKIIESYDGDNKEYVILLTGDTADIYASKDEDDSEYTFKYFLCCICPVKEPKTVLKYRSGEDGFRGFSTGLVLSNPVTGFMYPSLDEMSANESSALFFRKDAKNTQDLLVETLFEAGSAPLSNDLKKDIFGGNLSEALGDECSIDVVKAIHARLSEEMDTADPNQENKDISFEELHAVIEGEGVSDESLERFDETMQDTFGDSIDAGALYNEKKYEIRTADTVITTAPENGERIKTKEIDGVTYLLVPAGMDITVNGIPVRI